MKAPLPNDENERLQALINYEVLDTVPEQDFDDLTSIAAHICGTPIALVSLVDSDRQWFKSKVGIDAEETSRDVAFCAHAILGKEPLIVNDATQDERFRDNPLVTGGPKIRFYAGAPLNTPDSRKIGTLCVIDKRPRELTDDQRAALEALSRQVISQLELRGKIRALRETSQQLQKMRHVAESANRAKSDFLATMSHELRTPMNAIIGFSELIQEDAEDAGHEMYSSDLQKIQTSAKHLLTLINGVLDLSKVEAGKMKLYLEQFEIAPVVHEVAATVRTLIQSNANRLEICLQDDLGSMYSDLTRFRQILLNLLSNAAKFTQHGCVTLTVKRSKAVGQCRELITVEVVDTGIGMTDEQMARLFQPFSQADSSTTRHYGGTGLGLSLCRHFCQMLGGEISVDSAAGAGARFTVQLPLQAESPVDSAIVDSDRGA